MSISPIMEFHISRTARDQYGFDLSLFGLNGNVVFANFHAARIFAQKMNGKVDILRFPEKAVSAGQITAMGLIDEIIHYIVEIYRKETNQAIIDEAIKFIKTEYPEIDVEKTIKQFTDQFPPVRVYQGEIDTDEYLSGRTANRSNKSIVSEEIILLWLANVNPAFTPYKELFDDTDLSKRSDYKKIIDALKEFFETQPTFGPDNQNLLDMLRAPAVQSPHSLTGQLEFIRERWGYLLGKYFYRLLQSLDLIKEEEKDRFFGKGVSEVLDFHGRAGFGLTEEERFSQDKDWMPNLVLIAKNTYVWLDQLSKTYQKDIYRLDQVPDAELDKLASRGFTGLWLIGLWERSNASKRIKQLTGNPEAVSSAYSLYDYMIADDLGGYDAYQELKKRAWQRGIRLTADMVPNHVGIYSKWLIEHPEWFISLDYSPFPSYSFNGENLSEDSRVEIKIEDHYYDRTDAAVVFKRRDTWTGEEKYVYHGNDGTSMPWNDTAQLNYLNPEVREAAIQTILHVARMFSVIRFDAAMTLSKKHYQRLWFPEPGTGGDIPSRAEFGMTQGEFDKAMPNEFWREVVDRVAEEVPDTLLLAEAFWLMEGYFVRTLGMHRVYNSAFMNMLRDEKNAEYRQLIKNTLEFDPQILKRYVNFMNNPDEETAVAQFGKGDKYFGISLLLSTMPGLPMFGHGQVEGFTEKYGMEYRKAYWDESPDEHLVHRHYNEIFPLLHKRYLFADVSDFLLYDLYKQDGSVDENVFAYSNRAGQERGLVIYHNKWADTRGYIRQSAAYLDKEKGELIQKSLAEGLEIPNDPNAYILFRDQISGFEFIRNCQQIHRQGMFVDLGAYKYHAFTDFRIVSDTAWNQYAQLNDFLDGRGVPDLQEALQEIFYRPVHIPYRELVNAGMLRWMMTHVAHIHETPDSPDREGLIEEVDRKINTLLLEINNFTPKQTDIASIVDDLKVKTILSLDMNNLTKQVFKGKPPKTVSLQRTESFFTGLISEPHPRIEWAVLFTWLFTHQLGKTVDTENYEEISLSWIDEWLFGKIILQSFINLGMEEYTAQQGVRLVKILTKYQNWNLTKNNSGLNPYELLSSWLRDSNIQQYLTINRYQEILWFNKEAFVAFIRWMNAIAVLNAVSSIGDRKKLIEEFKYIDRVLNVYFETVEKSEFQVEKLLDLVKEKSQS